MFLVPAWYYEHILSGLKTLRNTCWIATIRVAYMTIQQFGVPQGAVYLIHGAT